MSGHREIESSESPGGSPAPDDPAGQPANPDTASRARTTRHTAIALVACAGALAAIVGARNALVADPLARLTAGRDIDESDESSGGDGSEQSNAGQRRVFTGSWYFPRGGPYILGFESASPARLLIDGRQVASGPGRVLARVVFPAGIKAVRLEQTVARQNRKNSDRSAGHPAAPAIRLLWHPPGRRGPPEYVPPSSLAAQPPDRAVFGSWAGASPGDGVASILAVLVIAMLLLYLGRARLARIDRRVAGWMLGVFVLALAVRLYDLGGAGQTWDEDVNWSAGRNYITNWLALDFAPASWEWNYEHPPVMKYLAGLGAQWADGYGPARALSALVVALACALMVAIGRHLYSLQVGVLSGFLAALSPHLIAHGKIVGHEAPTLLLWALAIWLCLRVHPPVDWQPRPGRPENSAHSTGWRHPLPGRLAVLGVVLGLALFSRFINGLLFVLCGAIVLLTAPAGRRWRTAGLLLAILVPVAIAVGFALWPRLWSEPITHLQEAWIKLKKPHSAEPFLGAITNRPARYYFAVYLGATAPVGVLAFAVTWLARAGARWRSERRATAIVLLWLAVPLVVMLSPVRQDGVRYIMPCLLALALMAASGVDFVISCLAARPAVRSAGYTIAGAALVVYLGAVCVRIHPYYLDYYGEHVGGPAGVAQHRRFEIAWWGEGIADAIEYINRHAAPRARVFKRCVEPSHLTWLRGDLWATEARRADRADWILVYQPSWRSCPLPRRSRLVHQVSAQGAALVRVYRVDR
ncbi:MAG: glycosyltransferase family 39 protein [Proteobacteria bacterium]|nr:glycosyltransferase family 39 protein [Pseudomonadota bacterium]